MTTDPTPPRRPGLAPAAPSATDGPDVGSVTAPSGREGPGRERVRALALLAAAVACETGGTAALQVSAGFSRPLPALAALLGYLLTIALFSRALAHGLALGIAYGTVTGCGLLAATVVGAALVGAAPTAPQAAGLLAILAGTLVLQLRPRPALPGRAAP